MITLYPDQEILLNKTRLALTRSKSVLMQLVTGGGKTVVTASMFKSAVAKDKRAMMVMPRHQLLNQTHDLFNSFNIDHSFFASGYAYNPHSKVFIATTETLARRLDRAPMVDLIAIDETHFGSVSLDKIINYYKKAGSYVIGLSATPKRTDGRGLGCWYDEMVSGENMHWLIDNKRLSQYRLFAPNTPDLTGIKKTAGDYNRHDLSERMEQDRVLIGNAVEHYRRHAMGRLNVAFCTSIKHSQIVAQSFCDAGIPAAHVDGETDKNELRRIICKFARREILTLTCCDLLTFGFDLANAAGIDVTVESLSDLRPTQSLALQLQKWGRALRYKDYPALIFDHSGNAQRFGLPDAEHEWSLLDDKRGTGSEKEKSVDCRQCPKCDYVHVPAPICPNCGHVYEIKNREIEERDGELQEITEIKIKVDRKKRRAACKTLDELIAFAEQEGYKNPMQWAVKWWSMREKYKRGGQSD